MDLWAQAVRTNVRLLVNSGQYDHKISEDIINQALTAGGDGNEDWKSVIRPIKRSLKAKLCEIGLFTSKKLMNRTMAAADLSPLDILSSIEDEYNSLMNTDEWPPAKNKVDPTAPPSQKFGASAALTTADTSLRPNGTPHNGKGKPKNFNPKKLRKNNKRNNKSTQSWKFKAPKQGEPHELVKDGVKWMWCQKCAQGKYLVLDLASLRLSRVVK